VDYDQTLHLVGFQELTDLWAKTSILLFDIGGEGISEEEEGEEKRGGLQKSLIYG
jgi:hypothetical protein